MISFMRTPAAVASFGSQPWRSRWAAVCWTGVALGFIVYNVLALGVSFRAPVLPLRSLALLADGSTPLDVVWMLWIAWAASLGAMHVLLRAPEGHAAEPARN
jgi:hypothetical protein